MNGKRIWIVAAAIGVLTLGAGAGIASGSVDRPGQDDAITGEALQKATAAALAAAGGGRVTDTELEDGSYEVEVLRANGEQVEFNLDEAFRVVSSEIDDDADEQGSDDTDD